MSGETCPVTVDEPGGWHSHRCSRPLKGERRDGVAVCGLHLAADRRAAKRQEAEDERLRQRQAEDDRLAAERQRLGVDVYAVYDSQGRKLGWGMVRLDDLARFAPPPAALPQPEEKP